MGSIIIVLSTGSYLLEPSLPISDFKGASASQQQVGYYRETTPSWTWVARSSTLLNTIEGLLHDD